MQSKAETVSVLASGVEKEQLTGLELYAMFRAKSMKEVLSTRRQDFADASKEEKMAMIEDVENEIDAFCLWLVETKDFDADTARHYSMSVKSQLLGVPAADSFAELFNLILRRV